MSDEKTEKVDSNDLSVEAPHTTPFFRGFFTGRQLLPAINLDRHSIFGTMIISALNCGIFYFIFRSRKAVQSAGGSKGMFAEAMKNARQMMDPLAGKSFRLEHKGTSFKDIIGVPEALKEVKQYVDFLNKPAVFTRLGARLPRGCLLTGDPGTGKTLLAKAVAGEAGVPFFSCSGADFIEVYAGSGPRRVRELFSDARAAAPCVVFIDEIDAIGSRGGNNRPSAGGVSGEENRTINQILSELDGLSTSDDSIVVFGATNHPDNLDKAIMREGRFDRKVELAMPDLSAREDLFRHYLKKIVTGDPESKTEETLRQEQEQKEKEKSNNNNNSKTTTTSTTTTTLAPELNKNNVTTTLDAAMSGGSGSSASGEKNAKISKELAGLTPGVSPAAVATIINEASLAAAIAGKPEVEMPFLRAAIDDVLIGRKHRSRLTDEAARRIALHESGHALVAWLLPQQRPVIKLSIIPRGNAGGFTQQLGREPGDHMTDTSLFSDICVMLGGRAAENTTHKDLSTGAQDDLRRATDVALKEFLAFGMSDNTMLAFDFNRLEAGRMYQHHSCKLQEEAEKESKVLVDEAMKCTQELLKTHSDKLKMLTEALVEKTELLPHDLEEMLGVRSKESGNWSAQVHSLARQALDRFSKKVVSVAEEVKVESKKMRAAADDDV